MSLGWLERNELAVVMFAGGDLVLHKGRAPRERAIPSGAGGLLWSFQPGWIVPTASGMAGKEPVLPMAAPGGRSLHSSGSWDPAPHARCLQQEPRWTGAGGGNSWCGTLWG
jgi:hypothetical protein